MKKENQKELLAEFSSSTIEDWRIEVASSLKGKSIESLNSTTYEDILVNPIYFPENSTKNDSSFPGISPFLRGAEPGMFRTKNWDICQELCVYDPSEYNRIICDDLKSGQTAIHLRILNPDNYNYGNINGTFISIVEDFETAFKNVDLTNYSISFSIDSGSYNTLDLFLEYIENKRYDPNKIKLYIDFDPVGEMVSNSGFQYDLDEVISNLTDITNKTNNYLILSKTLGINGYFFNEKGANAVQEISYSFAIALEYIDKFLDKGFEINKICNNIYFNLSVSNDFFMEIAKFRSARVLWSKIVAELGGNSDSQKMHIRAINSLRNKNVLDSQSNILRGTSEAISAILGGCEAITVRPYDIQSEKYQKLSSRIARNTQLVLQNECNLTEVIDPAGGSYFVEGLTKEILEKSYELLKVIEEEEGIINSIKSGLIHKQITDIVNQRILNFCTRKETLIGVNKYPNLDDELLSSTISNYNSEASDFAAKLKKSPINFKPCDSLDSIPVLLDYCISGEIVTLRLNSEKYKHENFQLPQVFALTFGSSKQYKGRYDFSKEFMAVGGIDLKFNGPFSGITDALESFILSPNQIFIICSDDESYLKIVPELVKSIKSIRPESIAILAGYPYDYIELFESAGIDIFIHLKSNVISTLQEIHSKLELNK